MADYVAPPINFVLDRGMLLRDALADNPEMVITDLTCDLGYSTHGQLIQGSADLAVADESLESLEKKRAFLSAGAIALEGFVYSDLADEYIERAVSVFRLRSVPISVLPQDPTVPEITGFVQLAEEGHAQHREFRDQTNQLMEYFADTTGIEGIGQYCFAGAGFVIDQLDKAWGRARTVIAETMAADVSKGVNWDDLLK